MNTQNTVTIQANALSHKAVGVRLSSSSFIGNPRDKNLTAEVTSDHKAESERFSVRKRIMKGPELNLCQSTLAAIRITVDQLSAPWLDGGIRIMPAKQIVASKIKVEEKIREFRDAVDSFISRYYDILDRDRKALNGTFRSEDYPTPSELRAKFDARLEFLPIDTDFRVQGIDESVRAELQQEADRLVVSRISEAKKDLLSRMAQRLGSLIGKVSEPIKEGTRFHESTVTNVIDACNEVKGANFDADQAIDLLANQVEAAIASLDPESLKKDQQARNEAKLTAEQALAQINSVMAGF